MAEALRAWLNAVIYTGVICGIALVITPSGRVKKALTILCGAAMCAAFISPLAGIDLDGYSETLAGFKLEAETFASQGEAYSKNLNRTIIEDECEAYILDKAENLGIQLDEVEVLAVWSDEGYWYPSEASIKGSLSQAERNRMSSYIEAELGISAGNQQWSGEDGN